MTFSPVTPWDRARESGSERKKERESDSERERERERGIDSRAREGVEHPGQFRTSIRRNLIAFAWVCVWIFPG